MTPLPPPQGMNEADYETIEAAVTETVRGRWFLGEFARRNRAAELRQVLDAIARLESAVAIGQQTLPPPSDPSIRLMMQRIKEIAGQLDGLSADMRDAGVERRFSEGVEHQARAVAGMMRVPGRGILPRVEPAPSSELAPAPRETAPRADPPRAAWMPQPDRPPALVGPASVGQSDDSRDPRLAALSALDGLALAQKLALFS